MHDDERTPTFFLRVHDIVNIMRGLRDKTENVVVLLSFLP